MSPRTKVVLPAPRSPLRRTRSPCVRVAPNFSPAASVSAGEVVTRSSKVIEAAHVHLQRHSIAADDLDDWIIGQRPKWDEPSAPDHLLRPNAYELCLFPTGERLLPARAFDRRNVRGPDDASGVGRGGEFLHLPEKAVGDVATAETCLVQTTTLVEARRQTQRATRLERERGSPQWTAHRDRPARL